MNIKMNKIISALVLLFLLTSCVSDTNKMALTGNIRGLKKGTLYLQKIKDSTLVSVDSTKINGDATFSFSEEIPEPELYYLFLKLDNGILLDDRISFFAEAKPINISTSLKSFTVDAKITGSENQDKMKLYNKIIQRYSNHNLELIEQSFSERQKGNDSLANKIDLSQKSIIAKKYLATISFSLSNSDSEISPYLMVTHVNNTKLIYLDSVYNKLTPKIKDSKYGKALESLIASRKVISQE